MARKNVLISIKPKYVQGILRGEKTVEIRRKCIGLKPGTVLWVYATLPRGQIELVAEVASISCGAPATIWRKYGSRTGLTKSEYGDYVNGCSRVAAIVLMSVREIDPGLKLDVLRAVSSSFHPPRSFMSVEPDSALLERLNTAERKNGSFKRAR